MSQLGKILLWVALVGAIAAVGIGVALVLQYADTRTTLATTQAAKRVDEQTIVKDKAENAALTADKNDLTSKLGDATTKVSDLTSQLDDAKKQVADATTLAQTANAAAKAAQDKLDAINLVLGSETPEQYKADKEKAESDLQAALAEQKIIQDSLQESEQKVATLSDALKRSPSGTQPPGISGKVTFVDNAWNFVILNVGISAGVVPNGELIVYRGRSFLGKVRVTKVDPNDAVAEILPDVKGVIQIGDAVLN